MREDASELVEQLHREAVRQTAEEQRREAELIERLHREAVECARQMPPPPVDGATLHYTQLPAAPPDSPLYREWNTYLREVCRLLAAGNAGRYVLIKDEQILGVWGTHEVALAEGYRRFFGQPFLVHQIQERERVPRCVTVHLCHNSSSPSRQAS